MSASRARRTRVVLEAASRSQDSEQPLVVIKVGGSLLSWSSAIERIEWLLSERRDSRCAIVCGGGMTADLVRRWQDMHGFSDEQAHELALRAVAFNESLLQAALPESSIVGSQDDLDAVWEDSGRPILACEPFVHDHHSDFDPLPRNWDVTSDSIAAWCAVRIAADELILAKSADLPTGLTPEEAAGCGLVDAHFPIARADLAVSWTNLRAGEPIVTGWL